MKLRDPRMRGFAVPSKVGFRVLGCSGFGFWVHGLCKESLKVNVFNSAPELKTLTIKVV